MTFMQTCWLNLEAIYFDPSTKCCPINALMYMSMNSVCAITSSFRHDDLKHLFTFSTFVKNRVCTADGRSCVQLIFRPCFYVKFGSMKNLDFNSGSHIHLFCMWQLAVEEKKTRVPLLQCKKSMWQLHICKIIINATRYQIMIKMPHYPF